MGIFHLQSLSTICIIGLSFSWAVLGFELVRQLLYHLSHAPALFALVMLEKGISIFAWVGLEPRSSLITAS
jgi:hypothetical protein